MSPFRFLIPLVASCLLATGCSLATYGYDAFPMYANWQLDKYLNLDDEQTELAKESVDHLVAWHRRSELPKYATFLRDVDARVSRSEESADVLHPVDVLTWRQQMLTAWPPVVDQVVAPVTRLLGSLRPEQIDHLKGKFEDANKEMTKKFKLATPQGMADARGDRLVERTEFFLGRLDSSQKKALREQAAAMPTDEALMLAERVGRQQKLLALIRRLQTEKPPPATGQKWTHDYLMTMFTPQDPQRRAQMEVSQQASDQLTARTLNNASPEQRRKLSKTLREFADDFDKRARAAAGGR